MKLSELIVNAKKNEIYIKSSLLLSNAILHDAAFTAILINLISLI